MTSITSWGEGLLAKVKKRHYFYRFLKVAIALGIAGVLCQFPLHSIEFFAYDLLFRAKPQSATSDQIRLIGIDKESFETYQGAPNALQHSKLIKQLKKENPKAVLYTINPEEIKGKAKEQIALAKNLQNLTNVMISIPNLEVQANASMFQLKKPFHSLATHQGILSEDKVNFGGDGVSRRAILSYQDKWFVHPLIAQIITGPKKVEAYKGVFDFKGSKQILTNTHQSGSFDIHSFSNVAKGDFLKGTFKGKIIILGNASSFEANDYVRTVYSRDIAAMPTLEYHANIIDTLIANDGIKQIPSWLTYVLTTLISLITLYFTFLLSPVKGISFILVTAISFAFISFGIFIGFNTWVTMAHPLLALFITYYFFIPYRLISESKKSWEYQQKNKLLTQVEELKNNFISMMSHDLKTPIARIQGMAEVAMQEEKRLEPSQKQALDNIRLSTEELNTFITSILNLSRVESKGLNLNLVSKDINLLVEEVIEKHLFQAKKKNIEISFEPEPIFSIKMDTDLIRQVLHNLVENAIKYSPENSRVLITTEENDGEISIQVSDQGIGIETDELEKIFYKFYRSKNVKSSTVKGSGLGLYLSSYFIELHKGKIHVESVPKQGSTFTVNLPL